MASKRAHSPSESHSDDRPSKRGKATPKHTSNKKRDKKNCVASDNDASDSDSLVGSERDAESDVSNAISLKDIKAARRTIARCCDMFCDIKKAVHLVMLSKQGESDSEDEDRGRVRKEALDRITPQVLARYKKVYYTLIYEIPSIKTLIEDPSRASTLKKTLKKINEAISETRSSDSARLREKLWTYILPNPKIDTMKPTINCSTSKLELGLNHVQLAGYICPVESVRAFNENAKETCKKLENGKIDMSASKLPAFLWEDNGTKYNEEDMYMGLFHGFYLERVARHIFTGPSTAHGEDSRAVRSCNAVLHRMDKVEAVHIAYAAVLARFGISSQSRWSEKDGRFNYRQFYYIIQDVINESKDIKWKEGLLKYYNMLFFKNEEGRGGDFKANDDESTTLDSTSKPSGFLTRLRAQSGRAARIAIPPPAITVDKTICPSSPKARMAIREPSPGPSPGPSLKEPPSTFVPTEACSNVPVTITPKPVGSTSLEDGSELSDIEFEVASAIPGNGKKKPAALKGKRNGTGKGSEGGPSKRRSGRKKAGGNNE